MQAGDPWMNHVASEAWLEGRSTRVPKKFNSYIKTPCLPDVIELGQTMTKQILSHNIMKSILSIRVYARGSVCVEIVLT